MEINLKEIEEILKVVQKNSSQLLKFEINFDFKCGKWEEKYNLTFNEKGCLLHSSLYRQSDWEQSDFSKDLEDILSKINHDLEEMTAHREIKKREIKCELKEAEEKLLKLKKALKNF